MVRKLKKPRVGDVLQLSTPKGFAYLHYIGRHPEYGDAVIVSPKLGKVADARTFSNGYVVFYPVMAAVAQCLVEVVDYLAPPKFPERFRRPGARSGLRVVTWVIEEGGNEIVKSTLSKDDLYLPIAMIWNHELLIHRVLEGWDPLQEGRTL